MNHFRRFEDTIEEILEGKIISLLGGQLHPVEIANLLSKALEGGCSHVKGGRLVAPNRFFVFVNPLDYDMLRPYAELLQEQFSAYVTQLAADNEFGIIGALRVVIQPMHSVPQARPRVSAYLDTPQSSWVCPGNTEPVPAE